MTHTMKSTDTIAVLVAQFLYQGVRGAAPFALEIQELDESHLWIRQVVEPVAAVAHNLYPAGIGGGRCFTAVSIVTLATAVHEQDHANRQDGDDGQSGQPGTASARCQQQFTP